MMKQKPATTGSKKEKQVCPCKGCDHNINAGDRVDYEDHDIEIGCKSKRLRGGLRGGQEIVLVKPTETIKTGCKERRKMEKRLVDIFK